MKKFVFTIILLLVLFPLGSLVYGQAGSNALTDKLNRIAGLLESLSQNDGSQESSIWQINAAASSSTSLLADECFNKIYYGQETPYAWSSNYLDNPWDLNAVVPMVNNMDNMAREMEQFGDMNGDGLADYLYVRSGGTTTYQSSTSCVYLNNGTGFDLIHYCTLISDVTGEKYYGSCADYSS